MFSNLVVRLGGLIGGIGNPSERTRGIDRYPKQTFMPMRQALTALHERVTPVMEPGADLVLQRARGTRSVPNPRGQLLGPRKERREKKKKEEKKGKKRATIHFGVLEKFFSGQRCLFCLPCRFHGGFPKGCLPHLPSHQHDQHADTLASFLSKWYFEFG